MKMEMVMDMVGVLVVTPARGLCPEKHKPTGFAPKSHVRGRKTAVLSEAAPRPRARRLRGPRAPSASPAPPPGPAPFSARSRRPLGAPAPPRGARTARVPDHRVGLHRPQGAPATPVHSPPSPPARPPVTYACAGPTRRPRDKSCAAAAPPAALGAAAAGDREEDGAEETGEERRRGPRRRGRRAAGHPAGAAQTQALLPGPPPFPVLGRKPHPRDLGTAPRGAE
ncbi:sterile alpha motif domain-containing protein 1-like [Hippopotamus amphibius kiboko]|uniref:sterile alpha motif domain-containing protein 1-like n=1 Tax=Hippopotamus amphibius kiboko TaxID=575201 RepID=UPI00259AB890|nr:sterile alpha motif domain-containing protein 1-like [Hippopotamus amphibius kiboko]